MFLAAASEQNDQSLPVFAKVNAISRPEIKPQCKHSCTHSLDAREITLLQPFKSDNNPGLCHLIDSLEPALEGISTKIVNVLACFD